MWVLAPTSFCVRQVALSTYTGGSLACQVLTVSSLNPSGAASCDIKAGIRQPSSGSHLFSLGLKQNNKIHGSHPNLHTFDYLPKHLQTWLYTYGHISTLTQFWF